MNPPHRLIRLGNLPEDMQQLLADKTHKYDLDDVVVPVRRVSLACFPALPWMTQNRRLADRETRSYRQPLLAGKLPPVVVVGKLFIDGCHRLTAAHFTNLATLEMVDLVDAGISEENIWDQDVIGIMKY